MAILTTIAWIFVILYALTIALLFIFQARLIFFPGRLSADYAFESVPPAREVWMTAEDGTRIHGLFFDRGFSRALLYFHGNAGDLSGWQYAAQDFNGLPYNLLMIDYRGYGKSSGRISEKGLYADADAAYAWLLEQGFSTSEILVYGRSVGTGVAVDLAARQPCKGLILESPFTSLGTLANEKLPLLFPSVYLRFPFNNLAKINAVKCPVIILHGTSDTLIPARHGERLFHHFRGTKKLVLIEGGAHNDLHAFARYRAFIERDITEFFP